MLNVKLGLEYLKSSRISHSEREGREEAEENEKTTQESIKRNKGKNWPRSQREGKKKAQKNASSQ